MTFQIKRLLAAAAVIAGAGLLSACEKQVEAPYDAGVCWHAIPMTDGTIKFNQLATNVPNIETCGARLEAMRIRFARMTMGNASREMMGAYQGNFLFLDARGIEVAPDMKKSRYLALVRTGDGRLAAPGSIREIPMPDDAAAPAAATPAPAAPAAK